ncbi:MAG: hypothetical protein AB7F91_15740 [Parvularculaceae bacterium]|nr:hypothetical protein [Parvularculaceae bacterium]
MARAIALWGGLCLLALVAAYLGASLYFCSGALDGDVAGCARSTGASFLQSPLALLALCVAALGLQYSAHRR